MSPTKKSTSVFVKVLFFVERLHHPTEDVCLVDYLNSVSQLAGS